jgi:hypothetical protein
VWRRSPALELIEAQEAYTGALFRAARRFADIYFPERWYVLSARYGLLSPRERIANYDERLANPNDPEKIGLLKHQLEQIVPKETELVVLTSRVYVEWLRNSAGSRSVRVPLAGLPLFERMRLLARVCSGAGARS